MVRDIHIPLLLVKILANGKNGNKICGVSNTVVIPDERGRWEMTLLQE